MSFNRPQHTIRTRCHVDGFGYWSGEDVRVEFHPAAANTGITFVRTDLAGDDPTLARIPVRPNLRVPMPRRTNLRHGSAQVDMVEHILAALVGLQIDNCEVRVSAQEMPGCDGSALAFVEALERAGREPQAALRECLEITEVVRVEEDGAWIEARPSSDSGWTIEYLLHYAHHRAVGRQSARVQITPECFRRELASCRTFVLESEAQELVRRGLGTRVAPHDLLLFDSEGPVENQLRFANECARHKALDVLGDLALIGCDLAGEIVAHRSGHQLNARLAEQLARLQNRVVSRGAA
jgi:UDP-3-O-acyl N-acetylglucosamine deacetylase